MGPLLWKLLSVSNLRGGPQNPSSQLTGGSVWCRAVVIVWNNRNWPELDGTSMQSSGGWVLKWFLNCLLCDGDVYCGTFCVYILMSCLVDNRLHINVLSSCKVAGMICFDITEKKSVLMIVRSSKDCCLYIPSYTVQTSNEVWFVCVCQMHVWYRDYYICHNLVHWLVKKCIMWSKLNSLFCENYL